MTAFFGENPAKPKKRNHLVLTNLLSNYEDIKGRNIEQIVYQIEKSNDLSTINNINFLKLEVSQTLLQRLLYCLNIANPKEWLFLTVFAMTVSFYTLLLDTIIVKGFNYRYKLLFMFSEDKEIFGISLYLITAIFLGLIATSVGYFISPNSDGSGVPELKVVLSGVNMKQFYDFNSLIGKSIGVISGLIAGLAIGRAGAYVHIAGIIGKHLLKIEYFDSIKQSTTGTRTVMVCSAALGITLALGTPIGAVVFAIEQSTSLFIVSNLLKCFYVNMLCIYFSNYVKNVTSLSINHLETGFTKYNSFTFDSMYFIILGILCGFLGAFVTIFLGKVAFTRRKSTNILYSNRFCYAVIVALYIAFCNVLVPPLRAGNNKINFVMWQPNHIGKYVLIKNDNSKGIAFSNTTLNESMYTNETLIDIVNNEFDNYIDAKDSQTYELNKTNDIYNDYYKYYSNLSLEETSEIYNDTQDYRMLEELNSEINNNNSANIILDDIKNTSIYSSSNINSNISSLNSKKFYNKMLKKTDNGEDPLLAFLHPNEYKILLFCFFLKFIAIILSNTANLPLGVIGNLLLLGGMFGRLYGHFISLSIGIEQEYIFALVGSACMLAASAHSIAAAVIIYELTGETAYLIHLLFSCLISNLIAQSLSVSIFDIIIFIRNLPYLPAVKSAKFNALTAKDIKEKVFYYLIINEDIELENIKYNNIIHNNINNNTGIIIDKNEVNKNNNNNLYNNEYLDDEKHIKFLEGDNNFEIFELYEPKGIFTESSKNLISVENEEEFALKLYNEKLNIENVNNFKHFKYGNSSKDINVRERTKRSETAVINNKEINLFALDNSNANQEIQTPLINQDSKRFMSISYKRKKEIDTMKSISSSNSSSDNNLQDIKNNQISNISLTNSNIAKRRYDTFDIISSLVLLYRLPKDYQIPIPIINYKKFIRYTIKANKLLQYIVSEFKKEYKNKLNILHSNNVDEDLINLIEVIDHLKTKFFFVNDFKLSKIVERYKFKFGGPAQKQKILSDRQKIEEDIYIKLYKLYLFSNNKKNNFLNKKLDFKSNLLDIDYSFLCVEPEFSSVRIQFIFTFISVNQLFVTDKGILTGIINKESFIQKAGNI